MRTINTAKPPRRTLFRPHESWPPGLCVRYAGFLLKLGNYPSIWIIYPGGVLSMLLNLSRRFMSFPPNFVFQKKTQRTRKQDIELAAKRYKAIEG